MKKNALILENEEIKQKKELLKKAEKILKQEFIGIDDIIDGILLNMRPWYLYPSLQDRPVVVTCVGLTGTGKSSLILRICELLKIKDNTIYNNFAEIGEMKAYEIEEKFDECTTGDDEARVLIYDEFQYAATLDENGCEKDNKSALKPFWELMDSGKLHRPFEVWRLASLVRLIEIIRIVNQRCTIVLKDGVWVNRTECLSHCTKFEKQSVENFYRDNYDYGSEFPVEERSTSKSNKKVNLIPMSVLHKIYPIYKRINPDAHMAILLERVAKMDINQTMAFLNEIVRETKGGYDINMEQAFIFVLMNLDEAYTISFNVNPDMLPDQFHKITKKLTIVDIKEALRKRFRNEQIARLGNLFMIYPSFSERNFKDIITLFLKKYAANVKKKWGIDLVFEDSVNDIIYKDSVFPTHGTRPIISAIHEFVKTKFPLAVDELGDKKIKNVDKMVYSYDDGKMKITSYSEGKVMYTFELPQKLRLENHRHSNNKEQQASTAVHESGHFVMYAKLYNKTPEKLCSTTIEKGTSGFLLKDDDDFDSLTSSDDCLKEIKVALAGHIAEKIVFGVKNVTTGASEDLSKATRWASAMVRKYGFGSNIGVTTYVSTDSRVNYEGMLIHDDSNTAVNSEIRKLLSICATEVENTLSQGPWKDMLCQSAKYLLENTNMPKEKMEEIYHSVPEKYRETVNERFYQDSLLTFCGDNK